VLCDEVFERKNYVTTNVWQKRTSPDMRAAISDGHEYVMVYAKDKDSFKKSINMLPISDEQAEAYKNLDNDPNGPWASSDFTAQGYRPNQMYTIITPAGVAYNPPEGRCWKNVESVYLEQLAKDVCGLGKMGKAFLEEKRI
jgi:adenine-specific DNA-methyltransferase